MHRSHYFGGVEMLLRFDPFRELDRFAEQAVRPPAVPMDASRHENHVTIRFDVPGVEPSDIDIEVERNVLTVGARRSWERGDGEQVLASERRHGTFTRQIHLGENLDTANVEADYRNGVLTVTIPVAETAKPRKVAVNVGDEPRAIDATSSEVGAGEGAGASQQTGSAAA